MSEGMFANKKSDSVSSMDSNEYERVK